MSRRQSVAQCLIKQILSLNINDGRHLPIEPLLVLKQYSRCLVVAASF